MWFCSASVRFTEIHSGCFFAFFYFTGWKFVIFRKEKVLHAWVFVFQTQNLNNPCWIPFSCFCFRILMHADSLSHFHTVKDLSIIELLLMILAVVISQSKCLLWLLYGQEYSFYSYELKSELSWMCLNVKILNYITSVSLNMLQIGCCKASLQQWVILSRIVCYSGWQLTLFLIIRHYHV